MCIILNSTGAVNWIYRPPAGGGSLLAVNGSINFLSAIHSFKLAPDILSLHKQVLQNYCNKLMQYFIRLSALFPVYLIS
jgi:hypothetical protein